MNKLMIIVSLLTLFVSPIHRIDGTKGIANTKTFADVEQFLATDNTHLMTYDAKTFNCVQFSGMMAKNAKSKGFITATVNLKFSHPDQDGFTGHEIVAFLTVDKGIIWIEPQDNSIYSSDFVINGMNINGGFELPVGHRKLCDEYDGFCWDEKIVSYQYNIP